LRGLYALVWFAYYSNWILLLLPLSLLLFRRDWKVLVPLAVVAGQLAYSVYVGGDAWEHHGGANRYISVAMPICFALLMTAAEELRGAPLDFVRRAASSGRFPACMVRLLRLALNFNLLLGDWKSIERWNPRETDYVAGSDTN
jgi:hypothetical protein